EQACGGGGAGGDEGDAVLVLGDGDVDGADGGVAVLVGDGVAEGVGADVPGGRGVGEGAVLVQGEVAVPGAGARAGDGDGGSVGDDVVVQDVPGQGGVLHGGVLVGVRCQLFGAGVPGGGVLGQGDPGGGGRSAGPGAVEHTLTGGRHGRLGDGLLARGRVGDFGGERELDESLTTRCVQKIQRADALPVQLPARGTRPAERRRVGGVRRVRPDSPVARRGPGVGRVTVARVAGQVRRDG